MIHNFWGSCDIKWLVSLFSIQTQIYMYTHLHFSILYWQIRTPIYDLGFIIYDLIIMYMYIYIIYVYMT